MNGSSATWVDSTSFLLVCLKKSHRQAQSPRFTNPPNPTNCRATREQSEDLASETAEEVLISADKCAELKTAANVRTTSRNFTKHPTCPYAAGDRTDETLRVEEVQTAISANNEQGQGLLFDLKRCKLLQATSVSRTRSKPSSDEMIISKTSILSHRPKSFDRAQRRLKSKSSSRSTIRSSTSTNSLWNKRRGGSHFEIVRFATKARSNSASWGPTVADRN